MHHRLLLDFRGRLRLWRHRRVADGPQSSAGRGAGGAAVRRAATGGHRTQRSICPSITRDMVVAIQGLVILFSGALEQLAAARGCRRRFYGWRSGVAGRWRHERFPRCARFLTLGGRCLRTAVPLMLCAMGGLFSEKQRHHRRRIGRQDADGRRSSPPLHHCGPDGFALGRAVPAPSLIAAVALAAAAWLCHHHAPGQPGRESGVAINILASRD